MLTTARARMAVRLPGHDQAAPAARAGVAVDWLVIGLAALLCLALWTTSTAVLLTSDRREGGRLLACRYFTGAGVVERRTLDPPAGAERRACPLVKVG